MQNERQIKSVPRPLLACERSRDIQTDVSAYIPNTKFFFTPTDGAALSLSNPFLHAWHDATVACRGFSKLLRRGRRPDKMNTAACLKGRLCEYADALMARDSYFSVRSLLVTVVFGECVREANN